MGAYVIFHASTWSLDKDSFISASSLVLRCLWLCPRLLWQAAVIAVGLISGLVLHAERELSPQHVTLYKGLEGLLRSSAGNSH